MSNKPVQAGKDGKKLQNKDKYKIKSQIFLAFFDNKKPHKNAGLRSSVIITNDEVPKAKRFWRRYAYCSPQETW